MAGASSPEKIEYAAPGPGQCLLHIIRSGPEDHLGRVFIQRADPVVAITEGLIRQIRAKESHPDVRLDGDVLVIDGANQRVAYRLAASGHAGYLLGKLA